MRIAKIVAQIFASVTLMKNKYYLSISHWGMLEVSGLQFAKSFDASNIETSIGYVEAIAANEDKLLNTGDKT